MKTACARNPKCGSESHTTDAAPLQPPKTLLSAASCWLNRSFGIGKTGSLPPQTSSLTPSLAKVTIRKLERERNFGTQYRRDSCRAVPPCWSPERLLSRRSRRRDSANHKTFFPGSARDYSQF